MTMIQSAPSLHVSARVPRLLATAFLALALVPAGRTPGHAQDAPAGNLAPGDAVEVEWAGEKVRGAFVEYFPNGWLTVRFNYMGIEMSPTLPPDQVRVLGKAAPGKAGKNAAGKNAGGSAGKRPLRTWTDRTGKFKTKARYIDLDGDTLTLETDKGKTLTLSLDKLADEDQAIARKIAAKAAKETPQEAAEGNPFAEGGGTPMPAAVATVEGDWSECRTLFIDASAPATLAPDGVAPTDLPAARATELVRGGRDSFFENVVAVLADRTGGKVCAVIRDARPGAAGTTRLQWVDPAKGKASAPIAFDGSLLPVGLSPGGTLLLARSDQAFSMQLTAPALGVWRVTDGGVEPVAAWNPKDPNSPHSLPPSSAAFVDDDHVLCVSFPNLMTLWNVPGRKAVYKLDTGGTGEPAMSPGGRYVAVPMADAVIVLEALSGETAARLPGAPAGTATLAFSPDGRRLAAASSQQIVVWDLEAGTQTHDFALGAPSWAGTLEWVEPGQLLLGGTDLIDLERRVALWRYGAAGQPAQAVRQGTKGTEVVRAATSPDRSVRALVPLRLPHDGARKMAASLDPAAILALGPGSAVSLDVRVQGTPAEQEAVRADLKARLAAAGLVARDGAPLVLQASTETGGTEEISYRTFGSLNRDGEKVSVTQQISRLRIYEGQRLLWESSATTGAPGFLQTKEGQSIQEALAPYQKPNLAFFTGAVLPRHLARAGEGGVYGQSEVTPQGVRDTGPPPAAPGGR